MKQRDDNQTIALHRDPDLFRAAVNYTSAETSFIPRLLEKDYFCTLMLQYLSSSDRALVFKGGTCLAKVHAGFYRLSEDLDFSISVPVDASRSTRSKKVAVIKDTLSCIQETIDAFRLIQPLTGANNSTQYVAVIGYVSLLGEQDDTIKIEIGLREPLLTLPTDGSVATSLLSPISGKPMVPPFSIPCISYQEGMAEKLRAALSRREPAIRDFYDIDYAMKNLNLKPLDTAFVELVKQKLAMPGNDPVDVSEPRRLALKRQLDTQLKPVLRARDYAKFDLDTTFTIVAEVAARLVE